MNNIIDIDPEGDVVLVCGEGEQQQKLRVASRAIMQASSVFNSLLSPRFKEGTELDALGTVEIPLPDDDPEAMRTACRVIHGQASEVSDQPSLEALTTLALLSDKYDLARSMHDLAEHWISRLRQQFMLPEGRRDLLQSAYYFEQDGWFAEIGRKILTGDVKNVPGGQEVKPFVGPAADRLDAALNALCAERDDIVQYIARAVEGLIGSFVGNRESARKLDLATKNHNKVRCLEGCALVEKRLHFVMQGLREEDLWPVTRLEQLPLGGTLRGLQDSRVSSANVEAYSREYVCDASVCVATSDVEPFESKPLLPWADEIMSDCGKLKPLPWVDEIMSRCRKRCQEVKSLCYLCVREGDVELLTEEGCKHERAAA